MGKAIAELGWERHSYVISTKLFWGIHEGVNMRNTLNRKYLMQAIDASLERMGLDFVDVLFCHRADPQTPIEETVWAMSDIIDAGKALYWGTSEWSADEIRAAWDIADRRNLHKPVVEQPQYNLFERRRVEKEYARLYEDIGLGLTTWSPLASGLLSGKYVDGIPEGSRASLPGYEWLRDVLTDPERNKKVRRLQDVADRFDATLSQLAIAWCAANPHVSTRHHRGQSGRAGAGEHGRDARARLADARRPARRSSPSSADLDDRRARERSRPSPRLTAVSSGEPRLLTPTFLRRHRVGARLLPGARDRGAGAAGLREGRSRRARVQRSAWWSVRSRWQRPCSVPLTGRIGDRHGRRILVVGGSATFAAVGRGLRTRRTRCRGWWPCASCRGSARPRCSSARRRPRRISRRRTGAGEAASYFSVAIYGGLGIGPVIGEAVRRAWGVSEVWLVAGGFGVARGGARPVRARTGRHAQPEAEAPAARRRRRRPHSDAGRGCGGCSIRRPSVPGVILLLATAGLAAFTAFMPLYALDLGLSGSGEVFLLYSVLVLVVRIGGARLPDRLGGTRAASAALALQTAGLRADGAVGDHGRAVRVDRGLRARRLADVSVAVAPGDRCRARRRARPGGGHVHAVLRHRAGRGRAGVRRRRHRRRQPCGVRRRRGAVRRRPGRPASRPAGAWGGPACHERGCECSGGSVTPRRAMMHDRPTAADRAGARSAAGRLSSARRTAGNLSRWRSASTSSTSVEMASCWRTRLPSAGKEAPLPTCPEWTVGDLVLHLGEVQRWAAATVASPPGVRADDGELAAAIAGAPRDLDGLVDWFRDGHAALIDTLLAADPAADSWHFLPAPSGTAFWARRQAHEAAMHRVDAERATGPASGFDAAFAVDGLDELLLGFMARSRGRLVSETPRSLGVRAVDTGDAWTVRIERDARVVTRDAQEADCVVSGPAADLYVLLWNRGPVDGVDLEGDRSVMELWRSKATISWS